MAPSSDDAGTLGAAFEKGNQQSLSQHARDALAAQPNAHHPL